MDLLQCIRGVVFFGTPHRGYAHFGSTLSLILSASSLRTHTNHQLVSALEADSSILWHINRSFVDRSKILNIVTFYETEKMNFTNSWVINSHHA